MPYNIKQLGEKSVNINFFYCRPYPWVEKFMGFIFMHDVLGEL